MVELASFLARACVGHFILGRSRPWTGLEELGSTHYFLESQPPCGKRGAYRIFALPTGNGSVSFLHLNRS